MGVVFRQSLKGTVVTFVGAFIGFLTTFFVTTKYLTPGEIGLTRVIYEAGMLLAGFGMLGTQSSAIRYYPYFATSDGRDQGFFRYLMLIPFVGGLILMGLYLLLRTPITDYFSRQSADFSHFYFWVIPMMFFIIYQTVLEIYATLRERVSVVKLNREVILRILLLAVYLTYAGRLVGLKGFIVLYVVTYGIAALLNLLYCRHLHPIGTRAPLSPVSSGLKKDFLSYTGLIVLASLSSNIVGRLDIFMVSSQMGFDYGGIYSIAFFMVAVIDIPSRSHISMTSPRVSAAVRENDYLKAQEIFKSVAHNQIIIGGLIFLLIWINIDAIFEVIPNTEIYRNGKWVVFFLGLGRLVDISFSFGNAILRYSPYYKWTIVLTLIVTILTIVANYYFILFWGITGAAIATLGSLLMNYTISQILLKWKMDISPMDRDYLYIVGLYAAVIVLHHLLPDLPNPYLNGILRSLILLPPTLYLLSGLKASQPLKQQSLSLWKIIREKLNSH